MYAILAQNHEFQIFAHFLNGKSCNSQAVLWVTELYDLEIILSVSHPTPTKSGFN